MKYLVVVIFILTVFTPVKAQSSELNLTGNLYNDSKIIMERYNSESQPQISLQNGERKSPILAGFLSLGLPGAGEFYAGNYLKAAIFFVVEVAVITTAVIYDKKGDDQTKKFERYANENWSVVKYAEWLNENQNASIQINPNESLPHWQRVNWTELNANEHGSHKLPPYGNQQYYELIGKYHQYSPGWNDFTGGQNNAQISPNFIFYSGERGKANDYYGVASTAVIVIYINHFLSALDAVWTASEFNKSLAVQMRVEQVQFANQIEMMPTVRLSFNF